MKDITKVIILLCQQKPNNLPDKTLGSFPPAHKLCYITLLHVKGNNINIQETLYQTWSMTLARCSKNGPMLTTFSSVSSIYVGNTPAFTSTWPSHLRTVCLQGLYNLLLFLFLRICTFSKLCPCGKITIFSTILVKFIPYRHHLPSLQTSVKAWCCFLFKS